MYKRQDAIAVDEGDLAVVHLVALGKGLVPLQGPIEFVVHIRTSLICLPVIPALFPCAGSESPDSPPAPCFHEGPPSDGTGICEGLGSRRRSGGFHRAGTRSPGSGDHTPRLSDFGSDHP